jgi:putative phosphoesterase
MRLVVLADVHSNLHALNAVLDEIDKLDIDKIVCAGDIVGYCAFPNECCAAIRERASEVVMGNHDLAALHTNDSGMNPFAARAVLWTAGRIEDKSKTYLGNLKHEARFSLGGKTLAMFHGSPTSIDEYVFEDKVTEELLGSVTADVLILGHTHVPCMMQLGGKQFVNPGSVGQPRDGDCRASFAILDTETMRCSVKRVNYDLDRAAEAIRTAGLPRFLADRLYRGM